MNNNERQTLLGIASSLLSLAGSGLYSVEILHNNNLITLVLPKDEAIRRAVWGTYGKSGQEPLKWVRLMDCSTEHLEAILRTQHHITNDIRYIIGEILKARAA